MEPSGKKIVKTAEQKAQASRGLPVLCQLYNPYRPVGEYPAPDYDLLEGLSGTKDLLSVAQWKDLKSKLHVWEVETSSHDNCIRICRPRRPQPT